MQILAVWGLLRSFGATTGPIFQATGRPDLATKIQAGKLLIVAVLIYPAATEYGIAGVAAVVVLNSLLFSEPLAGYLAVRTVDGSFARLARLLAYPVIASSLMAGVVLAARTVVPATVPGFGLLVLLGVAVYGAVVAGMDRFLGYDVRSVLRTVSDALGT
jgi:PST family polysaccharide transporter/lipopolysaccharide exporter